MITVLSGGTVVLADRVVEPGTLILESGRIVEVRGGSASAGEGVVDIKGKVIVPGFIDVHVHGVEG
jgi:N-acetylglucosamine-6-phosphate deacetylase